MSQEAEPSIIDYARFYGLTRDHLEDDPLDQFAPSYDYIAQLEDTSDLFQIRADSVKVPSERLVFDEDAASLLASVIAFTQQPLPQNSEYDKIDVHRVQRMKHELPLLRSDPETDLLHFAPRIVPDLENEFLPLETVDEEADEGLNWPKRCYTLPGEYAEKFKAEKLEVTSDAFAFLQSALNFHREDGAQETSEDVELPYTKKTQIRPISPPLLPRSPEVSPFIPSSETGRIELLSDRTSPTKDEAREVERAIFEDNAMNSETMLLGSEYLNGIENPSEAITEPQSSSPIPRRSLQDRKVEVPLSPPVSEQPPPWKRKVVSFQEALSEVIQDLPPPIPEPETISSDDIDAFFKETIRPIGIKAQRSIEQERLQEADTTLRVSVPVLDLSFPTAPWKALVHDSAASVEAACKNLLSEMKDLHFSNNIWPLSGKVERELKWTPFPAALGKVANQETIADDPFIEKYLAQPERVNTDTLTWKPEGVRILDELAESDEQLEEGTFPEERDIDSLVRKRKYEYELQAEDPPSNHQHVAEKARRRIEHEERLCGDRVQPSTDTFSALSALDIYMSVRKGRPEKQEPTADKYFAKASKPAAPAHPPTENIPLSVASATRKNVSMPSPVFTVPTAPVPFVVSASFLSNRKLARHIQRLYPTAEFIERDFNLYLDAQPPLPSRSDAVPTSQGTTADESDMIISPSIGLILTTLQKIKQRSLPGQTARSPVKDRITRASPRYEKLIVFVHEDRNAQNSSEIGASELDNSDCESLIEITSFSSSLESEVQIMFIAGGEDHLAKWIVATMIKYGTPNLKLIQDETLWEVLLRRAGMNAFAAQAILAELKAPKETERAIPENFGLGAFLKMSMKERFARFETLLGGRRSLARVSRILDARW